MSRTRLLLLLSSLPLTACGGEEGVEPPSGEHYHYVVSKALVPTDAPQAMEYGLDLNGDKIIDNQLGMALSTLAGLDFDVQSAITEAFDQGDIVLLLDLQTRSFSSTNGVGLQVMLGDPATVMPAACADAADMVCRRHLAGTGSFTVDADSPDNAAVAGKIVGGVFNGGPGDISLQIRLGGDAPIQLDLIGARAKATGMSDAKIDSVVVGGALPQDDLNEKVFPAIHAQLKPTIDDDCPPGGTPPDCNCGAGNSTGKTLLGQFDKNPVDCQVSLEEIKNHPLIVSLLSPDVTINGEMALSLGIKVEAVKATIR